MFAWHLTDICLHCQQGQPKSKTDVWITEKVTKSQVPIPKCMHICTCRLNKKKIKIQIMVWNAEHIKTNMRPLRVQHFNELFTKNSFKHTDRLEKGHLCNCWQSACQFYSNVREERGLNANRHMNEAREASLFKKCTTAALHSQNSLQLYCIFGSLLVRRL